MQIDINHTGAPEGVDLKANAAGGAEMGSVRVQRAMPMRDRRDDG